MFGDKHNDKQDNTAISQVKYEYETKLAEQKDRIFSLLEQNKELKSLLDSYVKKNSEISEALVKAIETSKEIERVAAMNYQNEIDDLKLFRTKWVKYFSMVKEQYPIDGQIEAINEFNNGIDDILNSELSAKEQVTEFNALMSQNDEIENAKSFDMTGTDEEIEMLSRKVMEELEKTGGSDEEQLQSSEIGVDSFDIEPNSGDIKNLQTNDLNTEEFKQQLSEEISEIDEEAEEQRERELFQKELGEEVANMRHTEASEDDFEFDEDGQHDFTKILNDEYVKNNVDKSSGVQTPEVIKESEDITETEISEDKLDSEILIESEEIRESEIEENDETIENEKLKEVDIAEETPEENEEFSLTNDIFDVSDDAEENVFREETEQPICEESIKDEIEDAEPIESSDLNTDALHEETNLEVLKEDVDESDDADINDILMEKVEKAETTLEFSNLDDAEFFDNFNETDFLSAVNKFADKDEITTLQTLFAGYSNIENQTEKVGEFDVLKSNDAQNNDGEESGGQFIFDKPDASKKPDDDSLDFTAMVVGNEEGLLFNPIEKINSVMNTESEPDAKVEIDVDEDADLMTLCQEFNLSE